MGLGQVVTGFFGGGASQMATLTAEEEARQLLYLIRHHYACTDCNSDGQTRTPLYYASIEGICGNKTVTLADLKDLPVENPPADYRMVDLFNVVPKAVRTDVSCLMNEFTFDRLSVKVNGQVDDKLSLLARNILRESEKMKSWSLHGMIFRGASQGDVYVRVRPSKDYKTGVQLDLACAESVVPRLAEWNQRRAESYRSIYSVLESDVPANMAMLSSASQLKETFVEVLDKDSVQVYQDDVAVEVNEQDDPISGPHPKGLDEPPMVHVAYRDSGEFFGLPAVDGDTVDLIDQGNVEAANLRQVTMAFGMPNLFLFGASQEESKGFFWGRRGVHGLPVDGSAKFVQFEGIKDLLEILARYGAVIKDRVVQFVIDDIRSGTTGESGIALEYRLFPYSTYLGHVELQLGIGIEDIVRIAFKILGKWPKDADVEVVLDWGSRFPVDVAGRLAAGKTRVELFGRLPEVIEHEARQEGYDDKEVKAIVAAVSATNKADQLAKETAAHGGGLFGATRAQELRAQQAALLGQGKNGGGP